VPGRAGTCITRGDGGVCESPRADGGSADGGSADGGVTAPPSVVCNDGGSTVIACRGDGGCRSTSVCVEGLGCTTPTPCRSDRDCRPCWTCQPVGCVPPPG
jgi:hypothetical protein